MNLQSNKTVRVNYFHKVAVLPVSPMTTIQTLLEEACQRFQLVSPSLFVLQYGRKTLQSSLIWRYAQLPSGINLDLVQTKKEDDNYTKEQKSSTIAFLDKVSIAKESDSEKLNIDMNQSVTPTNKKEISGSMIKIFYESCFKSNCSFFYQSFLIVLFLDETSLNEEEDYKIIADEMKAFITAQQKEREKLENMPLKTRAMLEKELNEKKEKYSKVNHFK